MILIPRIVVREEKEYLLKNSVDNSKIMVDDAYY